MSAKGIYVNTLKPIWDLCTLILKGICPNRKQSLFVTVVQQRFHQGNFTVLPSGATRKCTIICKRPSSSVFTCL